MAGPVEMGNLLVSQLVSYLQRHEVPCINIKGNLGIFTIDLMLATKVKTIFMLCC
jgi:hypothetical protein